jgi:hypothetical protein
MAQTVTAIEREISILESNLIQYQAARDDADGDAEAIKQAKAKIADTKDDLESARRRLAKAQAGLTQDEKQATLETNLADVVLVKKSGTLAAGAMGKAAGAYAEFIKHLQTAHQHGADAKDAALRIIRQLPARERDQAYTLAQGLAFADTSLGAAIESAMQKSGLFSDIAPAHWIRLQRHDLPPMDEFMQVRIDRLVAAVERATTKVNEAI